MIYFCDAAGTQVRCVPARVYQGSSEANEVVLCAPFAQSAQVRASFRLPNGEILPPAAMAYEGNAAAYDGEGTQLHCWRLALPAAVTQYYGEVTVQFYRISAEDTLAAQAVRFTVERGVPPESVAPAEDVYESISQSLAGMAADLGNGAFASRAVYAWNAAYTYGANEIAFCPEAGGGKGAFVRSLVSENEQPPYTEAGALNAQYWSEAVSFGELIAASQAAQAASVSAASDAAAAEGSASAAEGFADAAQASSASAQTYAGQAQTAAGNAAADAADAEESAQSAAASAELAQTYAQLGIQPNTQYTSLESLPAEGSTKFIYLIPNTESDPVDSYNEYIWVPDKEDYEFIGSTKIDLSDYAQKTGSYAGMSVGSAQNVTGSIGGKALSSVFEADGITAKKATAAQQDGDGNVISSAYAKKTGTYAGMTVGYATAAGSASSASNATNAVNANYAATAGNVESIYVHYIELYSNVGGSGQHIYAGAVIVNNSADPITSLHSYCTANGFEAEEVLPIHGTFYNSGKLYPVTGFYLTDTNLPYVRYILANGQTSFLLNYLGGNDTVVQIQ